MHDISIAAREITATRTYNASRDMVFKTWTDLERISNWWGPKGFTTTTSRMKVKKGGVWEFVMHGPDGTDYKKRNWTDKKEENEG